MIRRGASNSAPITGVFPDGAVLATYAQSGAFTDCYCIDVPRAVTQAQYVEAFYTSAVFKIERWILKFVDKPSTDAEASELAAGTRDRFAAWSVERRTRDQLLMCDYMNRTRSWLMVVPCGTPGLPVTRLYFGSAIVPVPDKATGKPTLGFSFKLLLGFHRHYSRVLLRSALARLR